MIQNLESPRLSRRVDRTDHERPGADPGFFLGGGALVSCSTSTPINHIVFFFCRIPVALENRRSSQGGGGVHTPCTLPLDPPLKTVRSLSLWFLTHINGK